MEWGIDSAGASRRIVESQVEEILNYFGKCPVCAYPARASAITAQFDDGDSKTIVVGTCGRPCGWNGPVPVTLMTEDDDSVQLVHRDRLLNSQAPARGHL